MIGSWFRRPGRAVYFGAGLVAVVLVVAVVIPSGPLRIESAWAEAMADFHNSYRTDVALVLNWLGKAAGVSLTLAAIGVVLAVRRLWLPLATFATAELLSTATSSSLKVLVARPRPAGGEVTAHGFAFPSGHTAYSAVTAAGLVLVFAERQRRLGAWVVAVLVICVMAWSRTYLGVHWLADVVAGALLGVGVALLVFGAAQQLGGLRRRA